MNDKNFEELSISQLLEELDNLEKSLDFCLKTSYNISETNEKLFEAEYTDEANEQMAELDILSRDKITTAISTFEQIGTKYRHLNKLGNGLFELKPDNVRAYFRYHPNRRKIIIIGLIVLKKQQKAPERYKKQADKNIADFLKKEGK